MALEKKLEWCHTKEIWTHCRFKQLRAVTFWFVHYSLPVIPNIQFPWALMLRSLFWVEIATLETITVYKCLRLHFPHVHYFAFTNTQFHLSLCCLVSQEFEKLLQLLMGILVSITMNNSVSSANFITPLLSIFSKSFTSVFKNTAPSGKPCRTLLTMLSIIKPKQFFVSYLLIS